MEPEESVTSAFFVCEYLKRKQNKKWCVHPINAVRHRDGHFYTSYTPLREVPAECLNYFKMKASTFDELRPRVQYHLKKSNTNMTKQHNAEAQRQKKPNK
jgi:hypothetical protein